MEKNEDQQEIFNTSEKETSAWGQDDPFNLLLFIKTYKYEFWPTKKVTHA